jgi:hypothetical protein
MIKSKRKVEHFINHLFTLYRVPRIPVHIHWHHPSLVDDQGNYGFGVLSLLDPANPCIHIAGKVLGKTGVMQTFAHEFGHYLQYLYGQDFDEEAAEKYADVIMDVCKFNRKHLVFVRFNRFIKWRNMRMAFPIYIDDEGKHSVVPPRNLPAIESRRERKE